MPISTQTPRHVLLLTSTLNIGGVENLILDTAVEMKLRGRYVPLVCNLTGRGSLIQQFQQAGITVFSLAEENVLGARVIPLRALRELVCTQHVDIVHMHQLYAGILGRVASLGLGIPTVYHTHNTTYNIGPLKQATENILTMLNTSVVIAVTGGMEDELLRKNPLAKGKTVVLHNAVNTGRLLKPLDYDKKAFRLSLGLGRDVAYVIGAIGRFTEAKNFDLLIDAFFDLLQEVPNAWLVIVGDGPLGDNLRSQARSLGIADRVTFTGFRSDVAALMGAFDLVVMPSRTEAFPLVALEALHCGTPLIVTENVSASNLLSGAVTVTKWDRSALGKQILRLLRSPDLRDRQAHYGKKLVEEEFCMTSYVRKLELIYDSLLSRDSCPPL